ncbi:hypothetical protein E2C01_006375 [Portunus trituberculatus]|uniref:Uncharacterized protein n=1 Tax=Portunus trituberculatus TaxID=210409 RepID=A0A5B7CX09_PORTR|nr:hypothetical protein [Portunus trituberculatus]
MVMPRDSGQCGGERLSVTTNCPLLRTSGSVIILTSPTTIKQKCTTSISLRQAVGPISPGPQITMSFNLCPTASQTAYEVQSLLDVLQAEKTVPSYLSFLMAGETE